MAVSNLTDSMNTKATLLDGFAAQHIVFVMRAREAIQFSEQAGVNFRGALYQALIERFSPNIPIPGLPFDLIRQFLEGLDDANPRGRNLPRLYAIEPPPSNAYYATGEQFEFGMTLFGQAINYIPYLLYALRDAANTGIGFGRGRFQLVRVGEINPINQSRRQLVDPHQASDLRLAITHQTIQYAIHVWNNDQILLRFLSPTRLTEHRGLVQRPHLGVLLRRLLERAQSLVEQNQLADQIALHRPLWKAEWERMGSLGDSLDADHLLTDETYWRDVNSYSRATGRVSPIGGFVGKARWHMTDKDVLYWLLWGQSLHVGKNTAKGNGWYLVE